MRLPVLLSCVAALAACSAKPGIRDAADAGEAGPAPPQTNAILNENRRPGDPGWSKFAPSHSHLVEGHADRVSARPGEAVSVMASSSITAAGQWKLFRIGWYGGAGARRILEGGGLSLATQKPCPADASTGLVRCSWTPSFTATIPADAVSGLYLFTVVRADGAGAFVPLVVQDGRRADLLFQASVTTWQAYNDWGGESLYDDDTGIPGGKALMVSFDRPYFTGNGAGHMLLWEAKLARFLERYGYDVTYTTNLDVGREGVDALRRGRAFLSVGHDEYWTGAERDAVEAARDEGISPLFFGANAAYWKIRASDPGPDGNARTLTCYKSFPERDPLAGTAERTGKFRDAPIDRPEEALVGAMYEGWMLFPQRWVVLDAGHFAFAGTGLSNGSAIPLLVGHEYDRTFARSSPAAGSIDVLARSPVVDAESRPGVAETTSYRAPSGALVFDAGSIYWSLGVASDPRVRRITANVLEAATGVAVPAELTDPEPPPEENAPIGTWAASVATLAWGFVGPAGVTQLGDGSILVADARAHQILRVADGKVSVFAGDGHSSSSSAYDNVPAARARFFHPTSVVADADGVVYVADTENDCIRAILADGARTVVAFAGSIGRGGQRDGVGAAARFEQPTGLALDPAQRRLLVADRGNHRIRAVDLRTREVTTLVGGPGLDRDGPAAQARITAPTAIAAAPDGRIFFVASGTKGISLEGRQVKMIQADKDRTVVSLTAGGFGFADGDGAVASLLPQGGLVWDGTALYVSDTGNRRIRKIVPGVDAATTKVTTVAGSGRAGSDDGPGAGATFTLPLGLWRAADRSILVADGAGTVRAIRP